MNMVEDMRCAFERILRGRGYDNYPADDGLFSELLDELVITAGHYIAAFGGDR